jgi:hypothetical protein
MPVILNLNNLIATGILIKCYLSVKLSVHVYTLFTDFRGNLCALNVTFEPLTLNSEGASFNSQPGVGYSDSGI